MNLLLDTHVFLWFISGDRRLSASVVNAICDPGNTVHFSAASLWEAVIKHALGRLPLPHPPAEWLPQQRAAHGILSLPIDELCLGKLASLPPLHRDPFDRVLIAQAPQHDLTIVTADEAIQQYQADFLAAG